MSYLSAVGKVKSVKPNTEAHEWVIENFEAIDLPTGSFITSPMITTDHPRIKWRLALYPKGRSIQFKDYLSVYIQLFSDMAEDSNMSKVTGSVRFSLLNFNGNYLERESLGNYTMKLLSETESYNGNLLLNAPGEDQFYEWKYLIDEDVLDANGSLKICCEIFFLTPSYSSSYQELHSIQDDYKQVFVDEKFSDFVLAIGDKEIRVHKAILASRSPVFEAMFTNELQEMKRNRVEITDVQYPVLKELLHFIYTDTVDDIENIDSDLLIAADKYCVSGLKTLCEKTLSNDLDIDNALERLILADTYNCAFLKRQVIYFIVYHSQEIIQTKEFISLRSDLMYEIIRVFSARSFAFL